jgi:hypothetical protein
MNPRLRSKRSKLNLNWTSPMINQSQSNQLTNKNQSMNKISPEIQETHTETLYNTSKELL